MNRGEVNTVDKQPKPDAPSIEEAQELIKIFTQLPPIAKASVTSYGLGLLDGMALKPAV